MQTTWRLPSCGDLPLAWTRKANLGSRTGSAGIVPSISSKYGSSEEETRLQRKCSQQARVLQPRLLSLLLLILLTAMMLASSAPTVFVGNMSVTSVSPTREGTSIRGMLAVAAAEDVVSSDGSGIAHKTFCDAVSCDLSDDNDDGVEVLPTMTKEDANAGLVPQYALEHRNLIVLLHHNGTVSAHNMRDGTKQWEVDTGGSIVTAFLDRFPTPKRISDDPFAVPFHVEGDMLYTRQPLRSEKEVKDCLKERVDESSYEHQDDCDAQPSQTSAAGGETEKELLQRQMHYFTNVSTLMRRRHVRHGHTDLYTTSTVKILDLDVNTGEDISNVAEYHVDNEQSGQEGGEEKAGASGIPHLLLPRLHVVRYDVVIHAKRGLEYEWQIRVAHFKFTEQSPKSVLSDENEERDPRFLSKLLPQLLSYGREFNPQQQENHTQPSAFPKKSSKALLAYKTRYAVSFFSLAEDVQNVGDYQLLIRGPSKNTAAWTQAINSKGLVAAFAWVSNSDVVQRIPVSRIHHDVFPLYTSTEAQARSSPSTDIHTTNGERHSIGFFLAPWDARAARYGEADGHLGFLTSDSLGKALVVRNSFGSGYVSTHVDESVRNGVPWFPHSRVVVEQHPDTYYRLWDDDAAADEWEDDNWEMFLQHSGLRRLSNSRNNGAASDSSSGSMGTSTTSPIAAANDFNFNSPYAAYVALMSYTWTRRSLYLLFQVTCFIISLVFTCFGIVPRGRLRSAWAQVDALVDGIRSSRPQSSRLGPVDAQNSGNGAYPMHASMTNSGVVYSYGWPTPLSSFQHPSGDADVRGTPMSLGASRGNMVDSSGWMIGDALASRDLDSMYSGNPVRDTPIQGYSRPTSGFSAGASGGQWNRANAGEFTGMPPHLARSGMGVRPVRADDLDNVRVTQSEEEEDEFNANAVTQPAHTESAEDNGTATLLDEEEDEESIDSGSDGDGWWRSGARKARDMSTTRFPPLNANPADDFSTSKRIENATAASDALVTWVPPDSMDVHSIEERKYAVQQKQQQAHQATLPPQLFQQHFQVLEKIGAGGEGCVFCVEHTVTRTKYAIKVILIHEEDGDRCIREAVVHSSLDYPYVVRFFYCWIEDVSQNMAAALNILDNDDGFDVNSITSMSNVDSMRDSMVQHRSSASVATNENLRMLFIQMEYFKDGTLADFFRVRNSFSRKENLEYLIQIADGLRYLHQQDIVHRDLKPTNIFVTENHIMKIGDFGLAKKKATVRYSEEMLGAGFLPAEDERTFTAGSPLYCSAEQLHGKTVTVASDIFSFGLICLEFYCMFSTLHERYRVLQDARMQQLPEDLVEDFPEEMELFKSMLSEHSVARPTSAKVLSKLKELHKRELRAPNAKPSSTAAAAALHQRREEDSTRDMEDAACSSVSSEFHGHTHSSPGIPSPKRFEMRSPPSLVRRNPSERFDSPHANLAPSHSVSIASLESESHSTASFDGVPTRVGIGSISILSDGRADEHVDSSPTGGQQSHAKAGTPTNSRRGNMSRNSVFGVITSPRAPDGSLERCLSANWGEYQLTAPPYGHAVEPEPIDERSAKSIASVMNRLPNVASAFSVNSTSSSTKGGPARPDSKETFID